MPSMLPTLAIAGFALTQGGPPQPKVSTVRVEVREIQPTLEALGSIEAVRVARPCASVEGLVDAVEVDQASVVEQGQVLLRMRRSIREIQRRQQEAELDLAHHQLLELEAGSREEELRATAAAVEEAQATLEEAEREVTRMETLRENETVSLRELTSAKARASALRSLLARKQAEHDRAVKGPRPEAIARAKADVALHVARLEEIDEQIARTEIKAPFAGVVTEKLVEVGAYLKTGDPVFTMVSMDPIRAMVSIPENLIAKVRPGLEVRIDLEALPGHQPLGRIDAVIPHGDPLAHTFPVRILLDNPRRELMPGMSVRARIPAGDALRALTVPKDAVVSSRGSTVVFAVRDGLAQQVAVQVIGEDRGLVQIRGDIEAGESVVVRGNERLRSGQKVQVVEESGDGTRGADKGL